MFAFPPKHAHTHSLTQQYYWQYWSSLPRTQKKIYRTSDITILTFCASACMRIFLVTYIHLLIMYPKPFFCIPGAKTFSFFFSYVIRPVVFLAHAAKKERTRSTHNSAVCGESKRRKKRNKVQSRYFSSRFLLSFLERAFSSPFLHHLHEFHWAHNEYHVLNLFPPYVYNTTCVVVVQWWWWKKSREDNQEKKNHSHWHMHAR